MTSLFPMSYFEVERFVFARLDEAERDATSDAERACLWALRRLAAVHSIWVDDRGVSHWRCATCPSIHGAPCVTLCLLAASWSNHPALPEWARHVAERYDLVDDTARAGGFLALRYPDHASTPGGAS